MKKQSIKHSEFVEHYLKARCATLKVIFWNEMEQKMHFVVFSKKKSLKINHFR